MRSLTSPRRISGAEGNTTPHAQFFLSGSGQTRFDMRYGVLQRLPAMLNRLSLRTTVESSGSIRAVSVVAVILIGAAALGGCSEGVLDPKGPIASGERQILFNSLGIMLAIVIPTILATLGVAFWFRASNERARYRPNFRYSGRLELLVWSIPAMTVFLVGGVAWVGSHDVSPRKPIASTEKALRIQVASLDWKWLFIYPDQGVASVNRLTSPVRTPVSLELTSSGVMNSFFVPQLGSQIYTMAGMITRLHLQADHSGTYRGFSAQFSGEGFSEMQSDDAMCRRNPTSMRAKK